VTRSAASGAVLPEIALNNPETHQAFFMILEGLQGWGKDI
jgi:hypothetical protein